MTNYTEEFKKLIVSKALSNPEISPRQVAREAGVASSTVYKWVKYYSMDVKGQFESTKRTPQDWTPEERFNMLVETANLTDEGRGIYCRQKGIYQHQLTQWRETFMQSKADTKQSQELAELKRLRAENKALKKELNRKDKALAETSALLILKKKAAFLWGEIEED